MTDGLFTKTRVVVSCPECEYERTFTERNRRVSGAVAGHTNSRCPGTPEVTVETLLICESCGYDATDGATVTAVGDRYHEDTLCGVCQRHRDERRVTAGIETLLKVDDEETDGPN